MYEISSYSLARQAQVSGRWSSGADFASFLAQTPTVQGLPWTVGELRLYLQQEAARDQGAASTADGASARRAGSAAPAHEHIRPRVVAAKAAQKVQGLIAKGVSTTYPEEEDVCWKKAAALIRAHGLTVEVSAGS